MTLKPALFLGNSVSITGTTSTGAGVAFSCPPLQRVAAQVVVNGTGAGTFTVEGSLNGINYATIFTSTYANSRIVGSSTIPPVTHIRARVTAHGSTKDVTISLAGR